MVRISVSPAAARALKFERYYDGSLAASASYTPAVGGLFTYPVGVSSTYPLVANLYSTANSSWLGIGLSNAGYIPPAIGDGSNFKITNQHSSSTAKIVVMRVS
jgi:hypothetical protein